MVLDQTSDKQVDAKRPGMKWCIRIIIVLTVIFITFFDGIQRIYTPMAINTNTLPVFQAWINFARLSAYDWEVRLRHPNDSYIRINETNIELGKADSKNILEKYFPADQISKIDWLVEYSYKNSYYRIVRKGNKIYFVSYKRLLFPCRAGVGYSLDGTSFETEHVNEYIDNAIFSNITGQWYYSKNMVLSGRRVDIPYTIPFSVFDYSKSTECIK
jgi:hypothetical protein